MPRSLTRSSLGLVCFLAACGYNPKLPPDDAQTKEAGATTDDAAGTGDTAEDAALASDGQGRTAEVSASDVNAPAWDAGLTGPDTNSAPVPDSAVSLDARVFDEVAHAVDLGVDNDAQVLSPDTAAPLLPDAFIPAPDAPQTDAYSPCPVPTLVYAEVEYQPPIVTGTVATYRCNLGYGSQVPVTRKCLDDGTWSGQAPSCAPVDCGQPPPITNGTREFGSTTYLGLARYYCLNDYVMSGGPSLTCQTDGTWSGPTPTCGRPQYRLTVSKTGTGMGTVTGASVGIDCGSTCEVVVDESRAVTLTATPDADQTFIGWETPMCPGRGTCSFILTSNTSIAARFSAPPNIMFVTSTKQSANLGGLAGADALCNQRAQAGGLPGNYKAWLSTATSSAASRMGSASGWVRPDGKPVLNRVSDIVLSKFFYPPRLDEMKVDQGHVQVMTGTASNGEAHLVYNTTTCDDFTSTANPTGTFVMAGFASGNSTAFTETTELSCQDPQRIYCMGVDRAADLLPPTPVQGRFAFTSKNTWMPGGGIVSADAHCQTEATAANLPGTYKALLATEGASAASRFSTAGPPWVRSDGIPLAATADAVFTTPLLDIPPNRSADGDMYFGWHSAWNGATAMNTAGTSATTCRNWMSAQDIDSGKSGQTGVTAVANLFGNHEFPCNTSLQLLCLQD